jgi:hypothetical protein
LLRRPWWRWAWQQHQFQGQGCSGQRSATTAGRAQRHHCSAQHFQARGRGRGGSCHTGCFLAPYSREPPRTSGAGVQRARCSEQFVQSAGAAGCGASG